MERNSEISILQILKDSFRKLKNKEILIATMTFVLVGTAVSTIFNPGDNLRIKDIVFGILGDFIALIGYMTIIKIVEKKYKKEEVDVKNIIKELIPRSFSALVLYLTVLILYLIGTLLVIIPGVLFCIFSAFYLQVFTLENNGIMDSISRSITLSEGFRGYIFKMFIIELIIGLINDYALLWLLKDLFNSTISSGVNIIISSVISSFMIIGYTSLYFKIKKIKTID
ncbi:hypothetical protein ACQPU1_12085 [Clostridium paraputrificum]|uniref:hypothetical protein n=1 Tax=Clostridium paraputrificum TaxID=29363 RepID=UPI003D341A90